MERQFAEICYLGDFLQCGSPDHCRERACEYHEIHRFCIVICGAVFPLAHIDWKSKIKKESRNPWDCKDFGFFVFKRVALLPVFRRRSTPD